MVKNKLKSNCPINYALEKLGDRWTLLIIRDLVFEGKRFYKEFLSSEEGIATNVLSDRLKTLESIGVIESSIYEKRRTQKIYSLTERGKDLIPTLVELMLWSADENESLNVSQVFVGKLKTSKDDMIKAIRDSIGTNKFSANG